MSEGNIGGRKFVHAGQPGTGADAATVHQSHQLAKDDPQEYGDTNQLWQALSDLSEYVKQTVHEIFTRLDTYGAAIGKTQEPAIPTRYKMLPDQLAQLMYNHIMATFHFPSPWANLDPAVKAGYVAVAELMMQQFDIYIKSK